MTFPLKRGEKKTWNIEVTHNHKYYVKRLKLWYKNVKQHGTSCRPFSESPFFYCYLDVEVIFDFNEVPLVCCIFCSAIVHVMSSLSEVWNEFLRTEEDCGKKDKLIYLRLHVINRYKPYEWLNTFRFSSILKKKKRFSH